MQYRVRMPLPREDHTSYYCISLCLPAWEYSPPITASNEFLPMSYYLQNLSHSPGVPGLGVIINSSLTYQWLREISYCNFQHKMKHPSRSQSWRNLFWEEWFQVIHHYEMEMQKPLKTPKMIQIKPVKSMISEGLYSAVLGPINIKMLNHSLYITVHFQGVWQELLRTPGTQSSFPDISLWSFPLFSIPGTANWRTEQFIKSSERFNYCSQNLSIRLLLTAPSALGFAGCE